MKLKSLIALRPFCFFTLLALVMLIIPCVMIPHWYVMVKRVEREVKLNHQNVQSSVHSEVESTAKSFVPIESSAPNLARVFSASFNETQFSFSTIKSHVAPMIFQALRVVPHLSQISFFGVDGLYFSYYANGNQTLAVYSNLTSASNSSTKSEATWYTQPASPETGILCGEAIRIPPLFSVNDTWFQEALNSTDGHALIGPGFSNELLLYNTVGINQKEVVSLGFSVEEIREVFYSQSLNGGSFYLASEDGMVLAEGLPNTHMILGDDLVTMQLIKPGEVINVGDVLCKPNDGTLRASTFNVEKTTYDFYCSRVEIIGIPSVYVLAFQHDNGLVNLVQENARLGLLLLVLLIMTMLIAIASFVLLIARAATREMQLCSSLIEQMETTQQAERKSMNKSHAFASASHDIRAALAGLVGLIDQCRGEVPQGSEIYTHLTQMNSCTNDLLGILNSILDASKIEAGMMKLAEEEFNVAELVEEAVDLFYHTAMKKGVDVVLDPCDGSILRYSRVRGDRGKFKQILWNLLSNAVKFTSDGHVTVRAWARNPSLENSVLVQENKRFLKRVLGLFNEKNQVYGDLEGGESAQRKPNSMDFVFEVDDTGKGIPKEKHMSVFENFVQVKEGEGGTGLGLGIVQSLVRLMGGKIEIIDKNVGEKGACFRFNVILTMSNTESIHNEAREEIQQHNAGSHGDSTPNKGTILCSPSLKIEGGSQVVLLIKGHERQRVTKKFFENFGVKVLVARHWDSLSRTLKRIKRKVKPSHQSSSGRSDSSGSDCIMSLSHNSEYGAEHMLPPYRKNSFVSRPNFVLLIVDANAGPLSELHRAIAEFRGDLQNISCKVVWLDEPKTRSADYGSLRRDQISPSDAIITLPFHGSRLHGLMGLLPEFGGTLQQTPHISMPEGACSEPSSPTYNKPKIQESQPSSPSLRGYARP
ncbi:Histidine kinase/HSP90-like ATPase, partial [Dillenia turbinata]